MENIIYFRLHDLSSSKWIDPPHTPPPPPPPAHTRRNDGESTRDEQSKKRTNGAAAVTGELGANFPLDLKGSQVESRFSKCSNTEERMYSSKITRVLGQKERKEGKKEKICFSTRYRIHELNRGIIAWQTLTRAASCSGRLGARLSGILSGRNRKGFHRKFHPPSIIFRLIINEGSRAKNEISRR